MLMIISRDASSILTPEAAVLHAGLVNERVAIMKMINKTRTTSVKGVILISDINFDFLILLFILFTAHEID